MRFVSLFTKTPSYQVFNYLPRYYNPQKEGTMEREARIKKEMGIAPIEHTGGHKTRIMGSFKDASQRIGRNKNTSGSSKAALIRLGTILLLVLCGIAYITWGNIALYGFMGFIPFYLYFKLKQR